jgi:hypothetical protein
VLSPSSVSRDPGATELSFERSRVHVMDIDRMEQAREKVIANMNDEQIIGTS